jgi:hypothetical protein
MTSHKYIICVTMLLFVCSMGGCKKTHSSHIIETDIGLIKTSLQLWQIDEGVRAFIEEKGWTYSQEFIHSWQFKLIASTPEGESISFECLQERTEKPVVTIYVPKDGIGNQQQLTNELIESIKYRFDR